MCWNLYQVYPWKLIYFLCSNCLLGVPWLTNAFILWIEPSSSVSSYPMFWHCQFIGLVTKILIIGLREAESMNINPKFWHGQLLDWFHYRFHHKFVVIPCLLGQRIWNFSVCYDEINWFQSSIKLSLRTNGHSCTTPKICACKKSDSFYLRKFAWNYLHVPC